jgi:archaellum component FlaC
MRFLKVAVLCFALVSISSGRSSFGQSSNSTTSDSAGRLPVTRVILYKNGVGYFEHAGHVRDSQDVNVDFTTAQLNDVLKSLTVLDLGKGRVTGVSYNSNAPLERRLGSLHLPVGENPTTAQFLEGLRGARLEVRSGSENASGRLLSIDEREIPIKGDQKVTVDQISIVSDSGEVRVFDLNPSTSVRVAEKDVNDEVGKYLSLVASTRDQDVRRMTISTAGEGERNLLVSYISEVPVWKSTYRIVIPNEGKPLLQGWAIVDNTVGEDWKNVELSLVAGAPQSFVQELSQPYYTRRPVVALPQNAMITPQTYEATMEQQAEVANGELVMPTRIPTGVVGGVPGGVPGGQAGGVIGGIVSSAPRLSMPAKSGIGSGNGRGLGGGTYEARAGRPDSTEVAESLEANTTTAQTRDLGDLFEYKLQDRVTIRKNQSALVPILQARIDAEKVSVWNPSERSVLRALWVDNTSALTLDGGSFNVLEGDAFAGEGLMDPIKPGEKRLLSYAADLGVLVEGKQKAENQRVTKVIIAHGSMMQSTQEREEHTYTIRNRDTASRTVVIEHPSRPGWKLTDDAKPAESSASFHRFRLAVESKKTETLTVKEYRPITNNYLLSNVTDDQIKYFVAQKMINAEIDKALRKVMAQKSSIAALDGEVASHKSKISGISEDQQRVRENMKALKGSVEEKALVARYVRELNEQEDRVQSLHHEMADLQQKREAAQKTLNDMIEDLQMEATL